MENTKDEGDEDKVTRKQLAREHKKRMKAGQTARRREELEEVEH